MPAFWVDLKGNPAGEFDVITVDDIKRGLWIPRKKTDRTVQKVTEYIKRLQQQFGL